MTEREQAGSDRAPAEVNLAFSRGVLVQALCLPGGAPRRRGLHVSRPGCEPGRDQTGRKASKARLVARPRPASDRTHSPSGDPGLPTLRAGAGGLLCVAARPDRSLPLLVVLPGAGSKPAAGLAPPSAARRRGRRHPLSPGSCDRTWDAIGGNHGPDVSSIHVPLKEVFESMLDRPRSPRDRRLLGRRLIRAIAWTGNGDLFTDLIAFSPGFIPPAERRGRPAVYIATAYPIRPPPPHEPADRAVAAVRGLPRRLP